MTQIILAIESSCDDTAAAVSIDAKIASNVVSSQLNHKKLGGVVPELASRQHDVKIFPVVQEALKRANVQKSQLDAIAFTRGPGLLGSLIVGVSFAKAMALSLNIPLIEVNHMNAHILAHFIDEPHPQFPFLCLTVSGGHTQIVRVNSASDMIVLGETIDDAAGEAFDKTGKILKLDYPAGPIIDKLARLGNPIYSFTEPKVDGLNFSFSGLKTSILYFLKKKMAEDKEFINNEINNICASVQHTIVSILTKKIAKAVEITGIKQIAISGGVSANSLLRQKIGELANENNWEHFIPKFEYCTDNAGMIAMAARFKLDSGEFCTQDITPEPRLKL